MSWRTRDDGRKFRTGGSRGGRSLYGRPARHAIYSKNIHWDSPKDADRSVSFANARWEKLSGKRTERVKLLQAMNEAANRAKVGKGPSSEEHEVLRRWVNEHKGKE